MPISISSNRTHKDSSSVFPSNRNCPLNDLFVCRSRLTKGNRKFHVTEEEANVVESKGTIGERRFAQSFDQSDELLRVESEENLIDEDRPDFRQNDERRERRSALRLNTHFTLILSSLAPMTRVEHRSSIESTSTESKFFNDQVHIRSSHRMKARFSCFPVRTAMSRSFNFQSNWKRRTNGTFVERRQAKIVQIRFDKKQRKKSIGSIVRALLSLSNYRDEKVEGKDNSIDENFLDFNFIEFDLLLNRQICNLSKLSKDKL